MSTGPSSSKELKADSTYSTTSSRDAPTMSSCSSSRFSHGLNDDDGQIFERLQPQSSKTAAPASDLVSGPIESPPTSLKSPSGKRKLTQQSNVKAPKSSSPKLDPTLLSTFETASTRTTNLSSSSSPFFGACLDGVGSSVCGGVEVFPPNSSTANATTTSASILSTTSPTRSCIMPCLPNDDSYKNQPHPFSLYRSSKKREVTPADEITDPLLASELASLSAQDREKLYDEIHGCSVQQHPLDNGLNQEFIETKLQEMEDEINKNRNKAAYNMAHFLAPSLVKDKKFRLMFLRSEHFDSKRASRKLIMYYEYKSILWGAEKVRVIVQY